MNEPVGGVQKWTLAFVYGLAGFLIGSVLAVLVAKVILLFVGATVLSTKAVQVIVLVAAASTGVAAAGGYLRHR